MLSVAPLRKKLRWAARRLRQRLSPGATILLYHRVADADADPHHICVSPHRFAQHLEILARIAAPLSLAETARRAASGTLPRRSVVLTFDDGYADNASNAAPLLERHAIPATVFVTSSAIGSPREFWWDDLERIVLLPPLLPPALSLQVNGAVRTWLVETAPHARESLHRSLYDMLYALRRPQRDAALEALREWAAVAAAARPSHRAMTGVELQRLAAHPLFEIGGHTATHPCLAHLPASEQDAEIRDGKARLEELVGKPLASFAYPHGAYTAETVRLVRGAGFRAACSTASDFVRRGSDLFQLPRLKVRDWSADVFERRLRAWLAG